jgi:succinylarginine dihydrolase
MRRETGIMLIVVLVMCVGIAVCHISWAMDIEREIAMLKAKVAALQAVEVSEYEVPVIDAIPVACSNGIKY